MPGSEPNPYENSEPAAKPQTEYVVDADAAAAEDATIVPSATGSEIVTTIPTASVPAVVASPTASAIPGGSLSTVVVTPGAGGEAESFLASELRDTRRSLMITRIASTLLTLFVMGYLGYITHRFQENLSPHTAASIAQGIIAEKVDEQAPQIAENIKARVPALIASIPNYALQQIPQYRQRLEDKVIGDIDGYAQSSSATLGTHLDDFLATHKDEVGELIENGQDPATVDKVGADLESTFVSYLKEKPAGNGESYQAKLDETLNILTETKQKMDRLANGKDLTPDELKARHAVAILSTGIDEQGKQLMPH